MKLAKAPCIEPTVGTKHIGGMSRLINALTKRDASLVKGSIPVMSGYLEPQPANNASCSASIPIISAGRPGSPISMRIYSTPVLASISLTTLTNWRIDAAPSSLALRRPLAIQMLSTVCLSNGLSMVLLFFD